MTFIDEAIQYFRGLLQINTTNELGTEYKAANYIRGILEENNIKSEIIYSSKGRASIISKLDGKNNKSINPIILLSHLDVVEANEEEWTVPPFSGTIENGKIWGRGTLDTKQLTVMHLMAFLHLKRLNKPLNHDVYFIVSADEENGSAEGMEFIAKKFPEIFHRSIVLSEGGGFTVKGDNGKTYMLYASGEKGTARVSITASGDGGHAGSPHDNQALMTLAEMLEMVLNMESLIGDYPILQQFHDQTKDSAFDEKGQKQLVNSLYEYMKYTTFSPEFISIGDQINVIPYKAEAILEFRTIPKLSKEQFEQIMMKWPVLHGVDYKLLSFQQGYESNPNGEIISRFRMLSERLGIKAEWVPFVALGKTDGRFIGEMAEQIYGLSPTLTLFTDALNRVHNVDEYIEMESFEYGIYLMKEVLEDFCISSGGEEIVSSAKGEIGPDHRLLK